MGLQSLFLKNFTMPKSEPFFTLRRGADFLLNIITVGFYGSIQQSIKKHELRELKVDQEHLTEELAKLTASWDVLQKELSSLLKKYHSQDPYSDSQTLRARSVRLSERKITPFPKSGTNITQIALTAITFVGQLLANVLTLGIYSLYRNHSLDNVILINQAENKHLTNKFHEINRERLEFIEENLALLDDVEEMAQTDTGKAFLQVKDLQTKQTKLQKDLQTLQTEKVAFEQLNGKLIQDNANKTADNQKLLAEAQKESEKARKLQQDLDKITSANKYQSEVQKLQREVGPIAPQYNRRKEDEPEIPGAMDLKTLDKAKYSPEQIKFMEDYNSRYYQKVVPGTVQRCFHDPDDELDSVIGIWKTCKDYDSKNPAHQIEVIKTAAGNFKFVILPASSKFKDLIHEKVAHLLEKIGLNDIEIFDKKSTAVEVIEASFIDRFHWLIALRGQKYKLNRSTGTGHTDGRFALYRLMALDLIMGAKLTGNGCAGTKLQINPDVCMLPSMPEKVLRYKDDQKGGQEPVLAIRLRQHDDFTPYEDATVQYGIDPVSVKWILEQLTEEEENILLDLLLSPVIEESHPDLIKTRKYVSNKFNPRVKLVLTAAELIERIGCAFSQKFGSTVFPKCWLMHANDDTILPFIKPDDVSLAKIPKDDNHVSSNHAGPVVKWEIDSTVISDLRLEGNSFKQKQPEFLPLFKSSMEQNQSLFRNLDKGILANPAKPHQDFKEVTLNQLSQSYYISHEMIGQFQATTYTPIKDKFGQPVFDKGIQQFDIVHGNLVGGQRCLFSNLLALFVTEKRYLTTENVLCLRRSIAAYLDKLMDAMQEWEHIQYKTKLTSDDLKIKEMAELAKNIKTAIYKTHNKCSVLSYQLWLREEFQYFYKGKWEYSYNIHELINPLNIQRRGTYQQKDNKGEMQTVANINISDLTPLEIQLAAFTFGVKIGVLPVMVNSSDQASPAKSDEYGRILPVAEFYGPNTKECLLMLCANESYYAAKERLDLSSNKQKLLDSTDYGNLVKLNAYWNSIKMS